MLALGYQRRRESHFRWIKAEIDAGRFGKLVQAEGNISRDRLGKIDLSSWRYQAAGMPGGVMLQIGIHYVDVLEMLMGPVKRVSGMLAQLVLPGDNPDVASLILEHENGAISNLTASYASASEYYMMNVYGKEASAYYDLFSGLRHLKRGETHGAAGRRSRRTTPFARSSRSSSHCVRTGAQAGNRRLLGDAQSRRHQGRRAERARGPRGRRRRRAGERRIGERHAAGSTSASSRSTSRSAAAGPAFLFIPGLVGLLNAWEFQMAEFSKRYRCISFDHRGAGDSDKPKDAYATELIARDAIALLDTLGIDKAHVAGTSTGGCVLQNLAIDHPERLHCCIFSNTWVKADEYITRVQMTRRRIALAYGPEEYVKVSSLFTNGAMQFRYDLDKVMELERRALATVAPVEVLAGRLDMTLKHDRTAELHKIRNPVADRRHPRRRHRAVLSVRGSAQGGRGLAPGDRRGRRPLFLPAPLAGVEPDRRRVPAGDGGCRLSRCRRGGRRTSSGNRQSALHINSW